jgi:hypothetical protein
MKYAALILVAMSLAACASKKKQDSAGLEKYPACYHKNVKISQKCIEKNEAGESVTALQLENAAYPGQYK